MSTIVHGDELRNLVLGNSPVQKSYTIAAETASLFTVAGGEVMITALWGVVGTTMTVANTVKLQTNPTTGDTVALTQADDLGTTDTAAGTVLMFQFDQDDTVNTPHVVKGAGNALTNTVVTTGTIEQVTTGSSPDGVIKWYCTWVPLTNGATLVAA